MTDAAVQPAHADAALPEASTLLRQAREAAGLHIAVLAATLKVPVERLQALEDGRLQDLPDLTFARALAISVCKVLKVDAAPVLQALPKAADVRLGDVEQRLNAPFSDRSGRGGSVRTAKVSSWSLPAWMALARIVVAAALWWWLPQQATSDTTTVTPLVDPAPLPAEVVAPRESAVDPVVPRQPSAPMLAPVPVAPTPEVVPAQALVAEPVTGSLLRLTARQPSWVQVTGASGTTLTQRKLEAGESVAFDSDAPLQVVVGRVDETDVWVRGKPLDLSARARNNVARFEVK